jgi:hypothetical protein
MNLLEQVVQGSDEAPHKAIIWIRAEVYDLTRTGECSGNPRYGINPFAIEIEGSNKPEVIRRLNERLEQIKTSHG